MIGKTISAIPAKPVPPIAVRYSQRAVKLQALAIVAVLALLGWLAWRQLGGSDLPPAVPVDNAASTAPAKPQPVRSAKGAFSMTLPDGWNGVLRMQGADWFVLPGEAQPQVLLGAGAKVVDAEMTTAGPYVFQAEVSKGFSAARGEAVDFIAGIGDKHLSGKKFTWDAALTPADPPDMGDKVYTYVFPLGGADGSRELRVTYRVYESDPRDGVAEVDKIVRSIRLHK